MTTINNNDSNVEKVCTALKSREAKGMKTDGVSTDRTAL